MFRRLQSLGYRLPVRPGRKRLEAEGTLCHPPRDLDFAHDNQIGAAALQVLDFSIRMSARDDLDFWVYRSPLLDDLAGLKPVRNRDQKATCFGQVRRVDHLGRGSVTLDHFDTPRS